MTGEEKSVRERDGYARSAGITYLLVKSRSLVHQSCLHVPWGLALSESAVKGVAIPNKNQRTQIHPLRALFRFTTAVRGISDGVLWR
jgi:hypothetical protein